MNYLQVIAPLIGVVLGSIISGIGVYWRNRTERKGVVARALCDLLEVRHHFVAIDVVLSQIRTKITVEQEDVQKIRTLVNTVTPLDGSIHMRYDEAISLLAEGDPVFAFHMRSKNKVLQLLDNIRETLAENGASSAQVELLEDALRSVMLPVLNDAVLKLAALHSLSTSRQVKNLVTAAGGDHPELTEFFNNIASLSQQESTLTENEKLG